MNATYCFWIAPLDFSVRLLHDYKPAADFKSSFHFRVCENTPFGPTLLLCFLIVGMVNLPKASSWGHLCSAPVVHMCFSFLCSRGRSFSLVTLQIYMFTIRTWLISWLNMKFGPKLKWLHVNLLESSCDGDSWIFTNPAGKETISWLIQNNQQ